VRLDPSKEIEKQRAEDEAKKDKKKIVKDFTDKISVQDLMIALQRLGESPSKAEVDLMIWVRPLPILTIVRRR
jgi:Ca2+-binding EF-hand superfamily protein